MKFLKWALIAILVLVSIIVVGGLLLPNHAHVERSANVDATPEQVYALLSNTHKMKEWSPWFGMDPNMNVTYTGPASGVGASYSWTSEVWNVGNGSYLITEAKPTSNISAQMSFGEETKATARFIIAANGKSSFVTWTFDSDANGNILGRWFGIMMDKMLGPDYERGLSQMSAAAQKIIVGRIDHLEEYQCAGGNGLGIRSTIPVANIGSTLAKSYSAIMQYMGQNNLTMDGYPMAIYHKWSGTSTDMEAVIPIRLPNAGNGVVKPVVFAKGPMIITHYYGPYEDSEKAHTACQQWLTSHGKTAVGAPFEEYVTDPMSEKDPAKWLTKVYYSY